ncbi:conserved hypothetical protein [Abyssogena phaseoliformis symbiont OG214]|uniref:hypothetical protein n=1 Tax=Abyssogena phaseoliformis symbiont TaxID=596095 RepID=UPI001915E8B2|nr:hypothetical protein [Abyssogena phaseoliformis symbiont]BBB22748.1 conserved hypothetical protein [Abyssogena phaseoliformis symbiont OG214]
MKKILLLGLLIISLNTTAFLDFNSYGAGYKNNDWPVWMERVDNNTNNRRYNYPYPYPYNNQAFNTNASRFNMNQMPTPSQAYQAENNTTPLIYETPAAMSFSTPNHTPVVNNSGSPKSYTDYRYSRSSHSF